MQIRKMKVERKSLNTVITHVPANAHLYHALPPPHSSVWAIENIQNLWVLEAYDLLHFLPRSSAQPRPKQPIGGPKHYHLREKRRSLNAGSYPAKKVLPAVFFFLFFRSSSLLCLQVGPIMPQVPLWLSPTGGCSSVIQRGSFIRFGYNKKTNRTPVPITKLRGA